MPNDKDWQRRSDEWVKMTHDSRIRKEAEQQNKYSSDNPKKPGSTKTTKANKRSKKK